MRQILNMCRFSWNAFTGGWLYVGDSAIEAMPEDRKRRKGGFEVEGGNPGNGATGEEFYDPASADPVVATAGDMP